MVLIMSVNPGFCGHKFNPNPLPKIRQLRRTIYERELGLLIEVGGGITIDNASEIINAGADGTGRRKYRFYSCRSNEDRKKVKNVG